MRFRHFFLSGLMVGAAMFLPNNVFAEKNELSGQQNSQKDSIEANSSVKTDHVAVPTNVPVKAENTKSSEKTVVVPEPASKKQEEVKQQPLNITPQPAAVPQNLPDQAKGNVQSAIKKTEKAVKVPGSEKVETVVQENNRRSEENSLTPKEAGGNSGLNSLYKPVTEVKKNKVQSVTLVEPKGEGSPLLIAKKEKVPVPTSKEEIPTVSQMINSTQRTNSTGGQSNDRISQGVSTISLLDKWFEWNKYYEINLVQPYLFRHTLMNNQWVNAPPSPPPQEAPFL